MISRLVYSYSSGTWVPFTTVLSTLKAAYQVYQREHCSTLLILHLVDSMPRRTERIAAEQARERWRDSQIEKTTLGQRDGLQRDSTLYPLTFSPALMSSRHVCDPM